VPVVEPEPIPEPVVEIVPEPTVESALVTIPEPMLEPVAVVEPEPVVEVALIPEPVIEVKPEPVVETKPEPVVAPVAEIDLPADLPNNTFGVTFPAGPKKGDTFLKVDVLPSTLFKFNGKTWIGVSKEMSQSYAYNDQYIAYLVQKIESGEYDVENLNETEREQIEKYLQVYLGK
jgi:hypothetical protein